MKAFKTARTTSIALALLATTAIALCPAAALAQNGKITIMSNMVTGNATGDQLNKNVAAFTAATGIEVDVQEVNGEDLSMTFEAASIAGEQADIVILNLTPDTVDWLPNGLVVDPTQYLEEWGFKGQIQPAAIAAWTNDAGLNGFPFQGFNWPIWYNTALLEKAGVASVPKTFDELITAVKALRAAGIQPFALGGKDWTAQNFVTWTGQQYITPEKAAEVFAKGDWCDPDVVKGLELFVRMRDEGAFIDNVAGYASDQMTNAYFTGEAAMMPSGSWAYTNAPPDIAEATELAGFPVPEGGHYTMPTAYNGFNTGFFLSPKGVENLDAVKQFFQYMYTSDVLKGWVSEASQTLAVTAESVAGATSDSPLVIKGSQVTDGNTSYMLLPDPYLPEGTDWGPTVTSEFLGQTGTTAADLCQKLEQQYGN